jgi:universal stress protein F
MERILVCLDKSPLAADVHRAALDTARDSGGKLRLFRVIEGSGELPLYAYESQIGSEKAELDRLASSDPPDLCAGSRVVNSPTPWRAICDAAREENADLIVIGAHSHGPVARALGTTAANVVNHADRRVLVIRPPGSPHA